MIDLLKNIAKRKYLRDGSKPVLNSGHGAYAEDPANVSGQHNQPSQVPAQYVPEITKQLNHNNNNK